MLEEIGVLYRGLVLGLMIAAPVGPIGLLCIRRTVQKGMLIGLATGLGAACADTVFGAIAVLGVSASLEFIHHYEASIRLIGGAVVLISAWHTWHGLIITITNHLTLFGTLAVVATFGGITEGLEADVMISGIFAGSALWWLLLSSGVAMLRGHFTENRIITVNRLTAIGLAVLGGWAILSGIHGYTG